MARPCGPGPDTLGPQHSRDGPLISGRTQTGSGVRLLDPNAVVLMSKKVRPRSGVEVRLTDIPGREVGPASQALEQIRGGLTMAVEPVQELLGFLG